MNKPNGFNFETIAISEDESNRALVLIFYYEYKLNSAISLKYTGRDFIKNLCKTHMAIQVSPEFQEWFITTYPEFVSKIANLNEELRIKHSHLAFGGKFGVFNVC